MIRAAVAHSTEADSARAALEVGRRLADRLAGEPPDWCLVFATPEHQPHLVRLQQTLTGCTGTPYVVGCSAAGVLTDELEIEQGPALAALAVRADGLRGTPFLFHDEGDRGVTAGVRLGQRLAASRGTGDLVVVCPDPFHVRPDRLLQGMEALLGNVPVVGGAASSRPPDGETFQFCGGEVGAHAVAGLRLGGAFRHRIGVTQGCRPLGRPLRVTRAHENLVLELEGQPATEALERHAPPGLLERAQQALDFLFVGLLPDASRTEAEPGEYLVRNIVALEPEAGIFGISDHVEEGQYLVFAHREPGAAREDLARVLDRLRPQRTGVEYRFGLYFNCLARGRSLYREPGIDTAVIRRALPDVPLLGFFCNAEIGPLRGINQLFTYTGVLTLCGE